MVDFGAFACQVLYERRVSTVSKRVARSGWRCRGGKTEVEDV
jgi:hypothetical protein